MLTTITVNGSDGLRFLSSTRSLPPALEVMRDRELASLEVEPEVAEQVAAFVDELGWRGNPPLLFSAQIGDTVVLARDALVEMHVPQRESRTWRLIAGGTRGRLVARRSELGKVMLLDGPEAHEHAYVSDASMTTVRKRRS
jgi:hypothetical protein